MKKFMGKLFIFCAMFTLTVVNIFANTPDTSIYQGHLFDSNNVPITTEHTIRLSLWQDTDFVGADLLGNGDINITSLNYGGWKEEQNFTPEFNGAFSIKIGETTPLPAIDSDIHKFLQVEIKAVGAPNTDYQLLDITGDDGSDIEDRHEINSIFYAKNTDKADKSFTIGGDNLVEDLVLQFGDALNKTLKWDFSNDYFVFNDDLHIEGDLTIDGTLTASNIATAIFDETYSLIPNFDSIFFDTDGINNTGSLYEGVEDINGHNHPTVIWKSRETTLQNYDSIMRYKLESNFSTFQATNILFYFATENTATDSSIDFTIEKEGLSGTDQLNGTGIGLTQNTFGSVNFNFIDDSIWEAGDVMVFKIKTYSKDSNQAEFGDIEINVQYAGL